MEQYNSSQTVLRLLITGANGFVGSALSDVAIRQGFLVRGALRTNSQLQPRVEATIVGEIDGTTDWVRALDGVDVVIHCAARVHVMNDKAVDPMSEFLKTNVEGTANLAYQAVKAGVKRLVFVSSVKVNGEQSSEGKPFTEDDLPAPQDAYGISKWEAEQTLLKIAQETGLEVVIVRPPLIYGARVGGNFLSLLRGVSRGLPLPLGAVSNGRSLLYVDNLADALILCATHPNASGQTYLVSDGQDVSTAELIRMIAKAMSCKSRLFYFPISLMRALALLMGRGDKVSRLLGSLQVSNAKIRKELGWVPRYSIEDGLKVTADWFRKETRL
ncbi:MAG: SDR family oxidoreductase [Sideroxydans sp.]